MFLICYLRKATRTIDADHLNKLTRLLCTMVKKIKKLGVFEKVMTEEMIEWWEEHQKLDRNHRREEKYKKELDRLESKQQAARDKIVRKYR